MKGKVNRNGVILGVAGVVGIVAAVSVQRYIQQRVDASRPAPAGATPMVELVVAAEALSRTSPLTSRNVAVRKFPAEWAHSNAIRAEQFAAVQNRKLGVDAKPGEPILWAQLEGHRAAAFSSVLAQGRRAITVPVDEISSISGMLEPGDTIDLIVATRHGGKVKLLPVMEDIKVLATGTQVVDADGAISQGRADEISSPTYTTVTLDATPLDARRIMAAREIGKVTALLRARGDTARVATRSEEALALLGLSKPSAGRPPVQVLYGGRPAQAVRALPPSALVPDSAEALQAAADREQTVVPR